MRKFIAMRHGQSEANVRGIFSNAMGKYPLTEKGIQQVKEAASQISDLDFDGIISSPILRTRQTARIVSEMLHLPVEVDERIRETDLDSLDEKPLREMSSVDRRELGIESWESQLDRLLDCVDSRDGSYILVSHALPIRVLICHYLGIVDEDACKGVEVGYASMSAVLCGKDSVLSVGSRYISAEFRKRYREW